MLESLKALHQVKHIQYLHTDREGNVLESDNSLISLKKGENLSDLHPFFEIIPEVVNAGEESIEYHSVHLKIKGKEIIVDMKMRVLEDGIFTVLNDLSDHYRYYQKLTQSRNESVISKELVAIKNRELEEREKFKDEFIRNFSHEIRNPLTSIIAMTNVLGATDLSEEQRKMVEFITESNTNLQLLLEDILSLSMIGAGKLEIREKVFDLTKLLELLEFTYKTKARDLGIEFKISLDPKIPSQLEGDRLRLFQILTNLLDNALRFTENGSVELRTELNQKWANTASIRFVVKDTGRGIPEDRKKEIFNSFTQIEPGRTQGSGLGLTIVKNLLELMGSEIKLESETGKGTLFYFDLALKFPLGLRSTEIKNELQSPDKIPDGKHRILMVEDDERVQMAVFKSLNDTGHFYIDLVSDGALVIQELMNSNYDLVLMDVDLPNSSGDQLTRIIRDLPFPAVSKIPVIGLTANAYEDTLIRCKESGMQEVVTKPYKKKELLAAIAKHL